MSACDTMKRSTAEVLYVTPGNFDLIQQGIKTATTRKGDRANVWPIGHELRIECNESGDTIQARITDIYTKRLEHILDAEAVDIGGYSAEEHRADYINIYGEPAADENVCVVYFEEI